MISVFACDLAKRSQIKEKNGWITKSVKVREQVCLFLSGSQVAPTTECTKTSKLKEELLREKKHLWKLRDPQTDAEAANLRWQETQPPDPWVRKSDSFAATSGWSPRSSDTASCCRPAPCSCSRSTPRQPARQKLTTSCLESEYTDGGKGKMEPSKQVSHVISKFKRTKRVDLPRKHQKYPLNKAYTHMCVHICIHTYTHTYSPHAHTSIDEKPTEAWTRKTITSYLD